MKNHQKHLTLFRELAKKTIIVAPKIQVPKTVGWVPKCDKIVRW